MSFVTAFSARPRPSVRGPGRDRSTPAFGCRVAAVLAGLVLCAVAVTGCNGHGQVQPDYAVTGWTNLQFKDYEGDDAPTHLSDVEVRCEVVTNADGTIESKCQFRNTGDDRVRFVFCNMADLIRGEEPDSPADRSTTEACWLETVRNGGDRELACTPISESECEGLRGSSNPVPCAGEEDSFHLGCREVVLGTDDASDEATKTFTSSASYDPTSSTDVRARDFEIQYADVWDLTDSGLSFDKTSCEKLIQQAGYLYPDVTPESAAWVAQHEPLADPYLAWQEPGTRQLASKPSYLTFEKTPCAPRGFPVAADGLPRCPDTEGRAPAVSVPLNLFWWRSHSADAEVSFPVRLTLETEGSLEGIRVETTPSIDSAFTIAGGEKRYGRLRLCDAAVEERCLAPPVERGRRIRVRVVFRDAETGDPLFHEGITFTEDRRPPIVTESGARWEPEGDLSIRLTARDETTAPVFANLWYSVDGGESWRQRQLEPDPPTLGGGAEAGEAPDAAAERVSSGENVRGFSGRLQIDPEVEEVRYFVGIQDRVYNRNYFGVARTTRP